MRVRSPPHSMVQATWHRHPTIGRTPSPGSRPRRCRHHRSSQWRWRSRGRRSWPTSGHRRRCGRDHPEIRRTRCRRPVSRPARSSELSPAPRGRTRSARRRRWPRGRRSRPLAAGSWIPLGLPTERILSGLDAWDDRSSAHLGSTELTRQGPRPPGGESGCLDRTQPEPPISPMTRATPSAKTTRPVSANVRAEYPRPTRCDSDGWRSTSRRQTTS